MFLMRLWVPKKRLEPKMNADEKALEKAKEQIKKLTEAQSKIKVEKPKSAKKSK